MFKIFYYSLSALLLLGSTAVMAGSPTVLITVDPDNLNGWFAKAGNTGTGGLSTNEPFSQSGPGTGTGSLEFITDGSDGQIIQAARIPLVKVEDIVNISWYFKSNHATNVPHAKVEYYSLSQGRSGTLVSVPSAGYTPGTWEIEHGSNLMWWSTEEGFGGGDLRTWAEWQTELAGIFSNYLVIGMGSTSGPVPATTAYADLVTITTVEQQLQYDFEGTALLPAEPKTNQIGIDNGYIKLDVTGGLAPSPDDCVDAVHYGRMVVEEGNGDLWICAAPGWRQFLAPMMY